MALCTQNKCTTKLHYTLAYVNDGTKLDKEKFVKFMKKKLREQFLNKMASLEMLRNVHRIEKSKGQHKPFFTTWLLSYLYFLNLLQKKTVMNKVWVDLVTNVILPNSLKFSKDVVVE